MMATFFSEIQKRELEKQGFRSTEVVMTAKEASLKGMLYAFPFLAFLTALYRLALVQRSISLDLAKLRSYFIFAFLLLANAVLHELLHGLGWALVGKAKWSSITFHIRGMLLSCSCHLALKKEAYLSGTLLPLLVLGSLSCLFLLVYPGTISLLTMLVNFTMAGSDLSIARKVLESDFIFIEGHPTKIGFIGYSL